MLSITELKELTGNKNLSDEDATKVIEACYAFAELILDILEEQPELNTEHLPCKR